MTDEMDTDDAAKCGYCNGMGVVPCERCRYGHGGYVTVWCGKCKQGGPVEHRHLMACPECNGNGFIDLTVRKL